MSSHCPYGQSVTPGSACRCDRCIGDRRRRTWDELTNQEQEDLATWFNCEPDEDDKARLAGLLEDGRFAAWDCPECGDRVYLGNPEDWGQFQGVLNADYTSYPGDPDTTPEDRIPQLCDDCRSRGAAYTDARTRPDTGTRPGAD